MAQEHSSDFLIDARGLVKKFGELTIIDGVDLQAKAGQIVSILGPSGSGKSTLLRCINLLEKPDAGQLSICGENVSIHNPDPEQLQKLRCRIPMVFQHFNLWSHMTALENVMEAPRTVLKQTKQDAKSHALSMLEKVGAAQCAAHYPSQLSGGQQQRVGIARALAMSPAAILFDEPTSALDPELISEVLRVIRQLAKEQVTMLIVTHEIAFAREVSDTILFLEQGKITAQGSPSILQNPPHERLRNFLAHNNQH